ncbi:MAG: hypothetical protein LRY71_02325 [Bacillaceae bacterium]|nr:hypothetical protein [Bacillaceae bacterium]
MRKSDELDQLRLDIGMIAETAQTLNEFYREITKTLKDTFSFDFGSAIYCCNDDYFSLYTYSGSLTEEEKVKFGDGLFSLSAIRASLVSVKQDGRFKVISPFYDKHHLSGFLVMEFPIADYNVSEEDLVFVKELTRFIELRHKRFFL